MIEKSGGGGGGGEGVFCFLKREGGRERGLSKNLLVSLAVELYRYFLSG